MSGRLEGSGYLFRGDVLVAPVRYRLRWATDQAGRAAAEGELMVRARCRLEPGGTPYVLHTGAGFSLPLEMPASPSQGWRPFRRLTRESSHHGMG